MRFLRLIAGSLAWFIPASLAAASLQEVQQTSDPFIAAATKGMKAWEALGEQENAPTPLKAVEPAWFNQDPPLREVASLDDKLIAGTRNGSLYVRERDSETVRTLAPAGSERWTIEDATWSPTGRYIAAKSIDDSAVPRITLTGPLLGPTGEQQVPYSRIGQPLPKVNVWIIEVATGKKVLIKKDADRPYINVVGWRRDERALRLLTADRYQHVLELRAADTQTGSSSVLHTERQPVSVTSLSLLHGFSKRLRDMNVVRFLPDGSFVWLSDRSGFQHLYLHRSDGREVRSLTAGKMKGFVDQLLEVDEPNRRLFARATGFDAGNPYRHKLVRIDLDDNRITDLVEADHIPNVRFSRDLKRIQLVKADFPSTVDIIEVSDTGQFLRKLFKTDWSEVEASGYIRPEITYVPAADGVTRIRAAVQLPFGFDPAKRYPVIHIIYSGQHTISTPLSPRNPGLWRDARMGGKNFIFVIIDGRGTPGRGRAFQNFDYGRFGQVQAADQITGLKALAATRPYMDLSRVGVMGGSWGGYFGLRTALEAPDLYKAGVFWSGAYEMSTMRVSAEPFMGCSKTECPNAYAKSSNLARIERLKAPLLLLHGTADNDVPIGETLALIEALKSHQKSFEFVRVEGWNHFVANWPEFPARTVAFFRQHLGGPERRSGSTNR